MWDSSVAHLRVMSSNNFHYRFSKRALLKSCILINPGPWTPCVCKRFQFTKQKSLLSFCVPPHKKNLLSESISLSTYLGSKKKDRKYIGMVKRTTLIRVILLPRDRRLPFQPANRFWILSMSGLHCNFLCLPGVSSNPKYAIGNLWTA